MATSDILDIDTLSNALGSVFLLPRICTLLRLSKSEVVQEGFEKVTFFCGSFASISLNTEMFIMKIYHY